MASSNNCPRVIKPWWASRALDFPADNANALPLAAHCSSVRASTDEAVNIFFHHQNFAEHFAVTVNKLKGRVTMLFITHQMIKALEVDERQLVLAGWQETSVRRAI